MRRARLLPIERVPASGTPVGLAHFGRRAVPFRLEAEARVRHTYVVGMTGSGKSTLLSRMILSDIEAGHGVALIDPHGSLVDEMLERMPAARADDVVVVDTADAERPIG